MSVTAKLIFQGVKFYWRTRNTIDVTMVDHVELNTTEVILFDPSLGIEAPRIYLKSTVLYSKLDHDDIEYQLSFAKRNCVPITEKFIDGIVNKAKSEYVLNRLVISEYSTERKTVVVTFQVSGIDCDRGDLICEMPEEFQPFKTVHHQHLMAGAVELAIQELNAEKAKLLTECDKAVELEKIAETSTRKLTYRERWRIPMVFVKISNGKRLNAPDAKIWTSVSQNMKTEEDATRMAAVLTRSMSQRSNHISPAPSTAPSRNVSFSGNHHVITPCSTPRHHGGAAQSKLHQATAATRHRAQATHGAGSGSHSRQNSFRQGDSGIHLSNSEEHSVTLKVSSKDEAGEGSFNSKRKAACKTPKSHKRPRSKQGGSRGEHKNLLGRLRRLSLSLTSAKTSRSSADAAGDDSAPDQSDGAEQELDDGQSTLQRMIAGLSTLNNSLRASFISTLSGKSGGSANSGKSGKSGTSAQTAVPRLPIGAEQRNTPNEPSPPIDRTLAIAVQQAAAGAALVPATAQVPYGSRKGLKEPADIPCTVKPTPQRYSFLSSLGVTTASNTADASIDAGADAAADPTASASGKKYVTNRSTTASAEFTVQGFFAGLVHWRSGNKIYVDGGANAVDA